MKIRYVHPKFRRVLRWLLPLLPAVLAVGGLLLGAQPASAQSTITGGCIQNVWQGHGNTSSLNCTANDVRIAQVTNICVPDSTQPSGQCCEAKGCQPTCRSGGNVTFTADFEVLLTAQARYDIGLYLATDGDPNGDGALTGTCLESIITSTNASNFGNADGDVCGDITNTPQFNPQHVVLTVTTACVGDSQGHLKLPNATSWRQPGSNTVCTGPNDAYPGSPSKCDVQPGFTINIQVETGTVSVGKTAVPNQVPEAGGTVTYTVTVTNQASVVTFTIDTLTDTLYGNLADPSNTNVSSNTCPSLVGTTLQPGASTSCTFEVFVQANFGSVVTDTAQVCGHDSAGHTGICDQHDATVTITDVASAPTLTKTALSATYQVDVTYQVIVTNNSTIDPITVNSLADDKFGDITTAHAASTGIDEVVSTTCATGGTITPNTNYTCSFVGRITTSPHTNTVTGNMTDDDAVNFTPSGNATVNVSVTFQ